MSFTLNFEESNWLEEFLGSSSKIPEIGETIRMNDQVIIFDNKVYLTFGPLTISNFDDPASNFNNG